MTASQAIERVEAELTGLGLKQLGEPIEGIEAAPYVSDYHGEAWRRLEDAFFVDHSVTPEEYVSSATAMIQECARARFSDRLECRLAELQREQVRTG